MVVFPVIQQGESSTRETPDEARRRRQLQRIAQGIEPRTALSTPQAIESAQLRDALQASERCLLKREETSLKSTPAPRREAGGRALPARPPGPDDGTREPEGAQRMAQPGISTRPSPTGGFPGMPQKPARSGARWGEAENPEPCKERTRKIAPAMSTASAAGRPDLWEDPALLGAKAGPDVGTKVQGPDPLPVFRLTLHTCLEQLLADAGRLPGTPSSSGAVLSRLGELESDMAALLDHAQQSADPQAWAQRHAALRAELEFFQAFCDGLPHEGQRSAICQALEKIVAGLAARIAEETKAPAASTKPSIVKDPVSASGTEAERNPLGELEQLLAAATKGSMQPEILLRQIGQLQQELAADGRLNAIHGKGKAAGGHFFVSGRGQSHLAELEKSLTALPPSAIKEAFRELLKKVQHVHAREEGKHFEMERECLAQVGQRQEHEMDRLRGETPVLLNLAKLS